MPIRLNRSDYDFLLRVREYCERGLVESRMAEAEGISLSTLRVRMFRFGMRIEKTTRRQVVRSGSFEPLDELIGRGELVVMEEMAA